MKRNPLDQMHSAYAVPALAGRDVVPSLILQTTRALHADGFRPAFDVDPDSVDAVRQKAGILGNRTVHIDDQFRGRGRSHRRLFKDEEIGAALRHRERFSSRQEELHFDTCRIAGGGK